jgi:sporulation integral membrane protein YtvI
MPFVIGWIISCIANPLVIVLERKLKIKRKAGIVVVILGAIAAVVGIGYGVGALLFKQVIGFLGDIPEMWNTLRSDFDNLGKILSQYVDINNPKFTEALNDLGNAIGDAIASIPSNLEITSFQGMGNMVGSIASVTISVIMCILSAYCFIADREWMHNFMEKYLPQSIFQKYDIFVSSLRRAVGGYFKAQLRIEVWMYVLLIVGFTILNVRYAFLIALLVAFLDFLPFFGTGIVLMPWAVISLIGGNYLRAIGFIVMWGVGQLFRQLIQPKIMGDSIGMEPIPTLFLLFTGYRLAGVVGMLVAVPIGIIVVNMNEAGFFDTPKYSLKILIKNLNRYRRLDKDDMKTLDEN